jgi:hypothetical protein
MIDMFTGHTTAVDQAKITACEKELQKFRQLFEGVQKLTGIQLIDVTIPSAAGELHTRVKVPCNFICK